MSYDVTNILSLIGFPGIPLLIICGGAYFAIWRGMRKAYVVANLLIVLILGLLFYQLDLSSLAPEPKTLWYVFFLFYLPIHLGMVGVVCWISLYLERQNKAV